MAFQDSDDVFRYLGGVFRTGLDDAELAPQLRQASLALQFHYSEPDTVVSVDTASGTVVTGDLEGTEPDVVLTMTADTANRFWQGKVNLPMALARGQVKVTGDKATLLKLAPLGRKLYPLYTERLTADGRDDLLA